MSLSGSFETLPVPEVLGLLAGSNKTGGLRLESDGSTASVYLADGWCVAAEGLDREGPCESVKELEVRLVDVCFEIARLETGTFAFDADATPGYDTSHRVDVSVAVVELEDQLEQWESIKQVIPSLEHRPRLSAALEIETIEFDSERWKLVVAVDGRRTVRQIVHKLGGGLIEVCREIASLVEVGAISMSRTAKSTAFAAIDDTEDESELSSVDLIVPAEPYGPGVDDSSDDDSAASAASDEQGDESDEEVDDVTVFDQEEVDAAIDAAQGQPDDADESESESEESPSVGDVTSVEDELEDLEAALGGPLDGLEDIAEQGDAEDVAAAVEALKERGKLPPDTSPDEVRDRGALLRLFSALRDS